MPGLILPFFSGEPAALPYTLLEGASLGKDLDRVALALGLELADMAVAPEGYGATTGREATGGQRAVLAADPQTSGVEGPPDIDAVHEYGGSATGLID